MDIVDYIQQGSQYRVKSDLEKTLGKVFEKFIIENGDEYAFLVPNDVLFDVESIRNLFDKYYCLELFDISNCFLGSYNQPFMFWHVSKEKPKYVKVSSFSGHAHPYRDDEQKPLTVPSVYNDKYLQYISCLNTWINTGEIPECNAECEYNNIPIEEFDERRPYPKYYKKIYITDRTLLKNAEFYKLYEVADIIPSYPIDGGRTVIKGKVLDYDKKPVYPFIPEACAIDNCISTVILHKGDIVKVHFGYFLVNQEPKFDLYAPIGSKIIRAKSLSKEYLYLYLNSETAKRIQNLLRVSICEHSSAVLEGGSILNLLVLKPDKNPEYYKALFNKIAFPNQRYFDSKVITQVDSLEDALSKEIVDKITVNCDAILKKLLADDISELNICFANKAYKATLIMAGSIMEAFLIDWLSEIRNEQYFEKGLRVKV